MQGCCGSERYCRGIGLTCGGLLVTHPWEQPTEYASRHSQMAQGEVRGRSGVCPGEMGQVGIKRSGAFL